MCCGRVGGVVGVVGAVLVLLGVTQLIAGIYFMLVLPIFQLGSNIWTGIWSGMCGIIVGIIGWRNQAMQRGQMVLMATLSVLMANVANLVILQVGENGLFLSEDDLRIIIESNQDTILIIAFWLTTVLTSLGIVVSFLGAQYLFCVVVRGPKVKGHIPVTRTLSEEGLHLRQVETIRFQPPKLALRTTDGVGLGNGGVSDSVNVHGFSGDGDDTLRSGSINLMCSSNHREGSNTEVSEEENITRKTSGPKSPASSVPYFLRNHRSAWQFIFPEVMREITQNDIFSASESFNHSHSGTSTSSKSSFRPSRPHIDPEVDQSNLMGRENQRNISPKVSSSCTTSLSSIPEACHQPGFGSRPAGRTLRPNEPPPPPPNFGSANLRSMTTGGWDSCAVIQYPLQAGGGFVVDLD